MNVKCGKLLVLLCVFSVSHVIHPQARSEATAALAGVLRGASGAIVSVHLEPVKEDPVRYYDGYEAVPQMDGSFAFTAIPAGDYRLTVESDAKLSMAAPGMGGGQPPQESRGFTPVFPADMSSGIVHLRAGERAKMS